ncbi:MAG: hypothetical protein E2O68_02220 [Deltaproteobacteria bacterium]|nr:MAG: hypothetical protein E2O68_02220 [Deltaproteobacteria bacterium]
MRILFLIIFFSFSAVAAQNVDILVNRFDKNLYNPKNLGLQKLTFEARIAGLTQSLKAKTIIENIHEIYFEVKWSNKTGFTLNVVGLPQGFKEIKYQLKMLLADKLYFFIPLKIKDTIKDYQGTAKKIDGKTHVTMIDTSNEKNISKVILVFDRRGRLNTIDSYALGYRTKTTMTLEKESWSRKKWVLNELLIENIQSNINSSTNYQVFYKKVGKFAFPETIDILTEVKTVVGKNSSESKVLGQVKSKITFSNFKSK